MKVKRLLSKIDELQKQINDKRPLDKEHLKSLRGYYRVGLTWASNALEGNTLTESETKIVIEDGLTINGKPLRDHLEASGHADAFDFMHTLVQKKEITENDLLSFHRYFYKKIDESNAGIYRNVQVFVSGSKYPVTPPEKIRSEMERVLKMLSGCRGNEHPVAAAAKAHKDFVFIHPFIDGNGRVARLLMNLVLLQEGYTIAVIPPVKRAEYIQSLEEAHTNDTKFVELVCSVVYETQKDYLRMLKGN